eukprot:2935575-Prymnesium_polylepis.1
MIRAQPRTRMTASYVVRRASHLSGWRGVRSAGHHSRNSAISVIYSRKLWLQLRIDSRSFSVCGALARAPESHNHTRRATASGRVYCVDREQSELDHAGSGVARRRPKLNVSWSVDH